MVVGEVLLNGDCSESVPEGRSESCWSSEVSEGNRNGAERSGGLVGSNPTPGARTITHGF